MKKLIMLLILMLCLVSCENTPLQQARNLVNIGDLRDDAITNLGVDAWYHQPCKNRYSIDDLFFYGSHKYDKAYIVIVTSVLDSEEYRVSQISSFEPYAWQSAYRDCIDLNKFTD